MLLNKTCNFIWDTYKLGMRRVGCIRLQLGTMARLVILLNLIVFVVVTTSAEETTTNYRQERQSDYDPNPIYGVASVAGVTSRNGRISSTGGVHFYSPDGRISSTGDGYYNPLTFTKAIDGKYASGSVQIHPGALGVSSSAQAGYIDPGFSWPVENSWPMREPARQWQQWPDQNQYYAFQPWFNKMKFDLPQSRRQWTYPSFNPFMNFWR